MQDTTKTIASFELAINTIHELVCDQLQDADESKELLIETAIGQLGGLVGTIKAIITAGTAV
jgi:hypothetical protein